MTPEASPTARGLHVGAAALAALAAVGFLTGVRGSARDVGAALATRPSPPTAPRARNYSDMRSGSWGPNSALYPALFTQLSPAAPSASTPLPPQTDADKLAALERRARRRAYDGAPPTIPHRIDQIEAPSCLGCHESGAVVAGITAPKMSHARHDNCAQCHVVAADPRPTASTPPPITSNSFLGLPSPSAGSRAWPGAPPTTPHAISMRGECNSCHGPLGAQGMKTTHPWRQNCLQCHALSAALDQRPAADPRPPFDPLVQP